MKALLVSVCAVLLALAGCSGDPSFQAPPDSDVDLDGLGWPREIESGDALIVVYAPEVESLRGDILTARVAVSVAWTPSSDPVFGAAWIEARLLIDRDQRLATPVGARVTEVRFPASSAEELARLRSIVGAEVPRWELALSLDDLLAQMALLDEQRAAAQGLRNDPPAIVYRERPTVLLAIDGDPAWRDAPGGALRRLANSRFFVAQDVSTGRCYLRIDPFWWSAGDVLGPWAAVGTVPGAVEQAWKDEPKPDLPAPEAGEGVPERPDVVVSTVPAELVWTDGPAEFAAIPGTDLLYVTNTDSDLFLEIRTQAYYLLLSGRWYRGKGGGSPWEFVPPDRLPLDFLRIPVGSAKQHVLASVAGTQAARDAVLDAQIPQTAAVRRGAASGLTVTWDGAPEFERAEGCAVLYGLNTPYSVFLVNGRYYCCHDGIWYESGAAWGPWVICILVPTEIYLIPPGCPHYYCVYCRVFGWTDDVVYVGYYPGYFGCYVSGPTVVFGTGWGYRCWRGQDWYPCPVTWGVAVRYDAWTGCWRFGLGYTGPCVWAGIRARRWSWHRSWSVGIGGWWEGAGHVRKRERDRGEREGEAKFREREQERTDVHRNLDFGRHEDARSVQNVYPRQPARVAPAPPAAAPRPRTLAPDRRLPERVLTDREGNTYQRSAGDWQRWSREGWKRLQPEPRREVPRIETPRRELEQRSRAQDLGRERNRSFQERPRPSAPVQPRAPRQPQPQPRRSR